MANTIIQFKRSTSSAIPVAGSLTPAEPAYSFQSDKLFIGNTAGTGVIEIGGKFYVDMTQLAYAHANAAFGVANTGSGASANATLAFNQANTARTHANAAHETSNAAFVQANTARTHANAAHLTANAAFDQANTARTHANTAHATANAAFNQANTARDHANVAFATANSKFSSNGGSITGDVSITGNLILSGNTTFINVSTYKVNDPLLYLAGNNYTSDIVDIGFVGNYSNGACTEVHTGVVRSASTKEFYFFHGYNKEPNENYIDVSANGFTLGVLNADIRTSNLNLGGINAISWIRATYDQANTARVHANAAHETANAGFVQANTARTHANTAHATANAAYDQANTARTHANTAHLTANAAYDQANTARTHANTAHLTANAAFNAANTANTNAANASFLSVGTVPSSVISGAYSGITGVGIIASGTWQGDPVKVPYGGTGMVTFTTNGILYGNAAGDLKVTSAGTEGQVLQASATGVPQFSMLDGGTF